MVRDCRPDDIGASVSYPLPGTAFFERVRRDLGEKQNWVDSADLAMLYRGPFPTEFYRALHVVLHKEFRARKALTELRGVLTRPWTARPVHARRAAGMIHHLATLPFARRTMDRLAAPLAPDSRSRSEEETRRAFDAVAADYDGPLGNNALIQQMRAHLWQEVDRRVPAGGKLLDLGCGTGIDAIHFGQQGYHVTAIDLSPNMVERTRRRAEADGVGQRVHAHVLSMRELRSAPESEFDCIYSDLGPLNCADDLGEVAAACSTLLRPGGVFVASVIGRICPWEIGLYLARRQVRRALLRFRTGLIAVPLQGETVWTRYYTPGEMKRLFSPWFDTSICRALGLFSPPPYLVKAYDSRPRLGRLLTRMDDRVGTWPVFREMGDHFLVVLTKRA
jgi:SAM-dependent methyltransferase